MYKRAASGPGMPLILTHGWPSTFLDYVDMLPMLGDFDLRDILLARIWILIASAPGRYQLSIRLGTLAPAHVQARPSPGHGPSGYDFGVGGTTILPLDHPESVIGIHLMTLESDLTPVVDDANLSDAERSYLAVNQERDATE